jgi:hypothetical protein
MPYRNLLVNVLSSMCISSWNLKSLFKLKQLDGRNSLQSLFSKEKYCLEEQNDKSPKCIAKPLKSNSTRLVYGNVLPKSHSALKVNKYRRVKRKKKATPLYFNLLNYSQFLLSTLLPKFGSGLDTHFKWGPVM